MKDRLEGMNKKFQEGYTVGTSIASNCLNSCGLNNISQSCEVASQYYRDNESEDFISGMDTGISYVVNEASRRMYGPKERMRKVYRR